MESRPRLPGPEGGNVIKNSLGVEKFVPLFMTYSEEEWQDLWGGHR